MTLYIYSKYIYIYIVMTLTARMLWGSHTRLQENFENM